jgi:hypothetical protein
MAHMKNKNLWGKILLVLQLTQLITPTTNLNASSKNQSDELTTSINHHLPSRKAFKELAEIWEGLAPEAYVKSSNNKINADTCAITQYKTRIRSS